MSERLLFTHITDILSMKLYYLI